ncbi:putative MFS-type transporter YybF [Geotalea uraniireducens]|uniref:MFS-type transporter YybF n=1 Tax=Geotalea uraniireducens TaxID=351604 RepID=A0ABM8EK90_9BACT|nr:MFS transporter [Geotalea uraniireducens]BDV42870.1 putative MFS-type transporter YybF [Geotalea uraniireducens]
MNELTVQEADFIESGSRTFRQTNLAFFAAGFVTFITLYDVQPLLPEFAREFGVPAAMASLPLSVTTCTLAVAMLLAGTISETLGRKPVMVFSLVLTSLLALLTACSHSLASLIAIRFVQGIVLAGLPSVAMAYLSEEIAPSSIGAAMGLYISGNAIGGMTGRIFTATVTDLASWRLAMALIGVACLALSGYFIRHLPPSNHFRRHPFAVRYLFTSLAGQLRDPALLALYGLAFMVMGSFVTLYNYITFRLLGHPYNLSQTLVSLIFLVYFLGSYSSSAMGALVNRFGRRPLIRAGLTAMALGTAITLAAPLPLIIVGIAIFTCGFFGTHSVASSWVGRHARTAKAQASSLYLFFYYLGSSISGTAGGFCWTHAGWGGVAGLIGLLLASALLITTRQADTA